MGIFDFLKIRKDPFDEYRMHVKDYNYQFIEEIQKGLIPLNNTPNLIFLGKYGFLINGLLKEILDVRIPITINSYDQSISCHISYNKIGAISFHLYEINNNICISFSWSPNYWTSTDSNKLKWTYPVSFDQKIILVFLNRKLKRWYKKIVLDITGVNFYDIEGFLNFSGKDLISLLEICESLKSISKSMNCNVPQTKQYHFKMLKKCNENELNRLFDEYTLLSTIEIFESIYKNDNKYPPSEIKRIWTKEYCNKQRFQLSNNEKIIQDLYKSFPLIMQKLIDAQRMGDPDEFNKLLIEHPDYK